MLLPEPYLDLHLPPGHPTFCTASLEADILVPSMNRTHMQEALVDYRDNVMMTHPPITRQLNATECCACTQTNLKRNLLSKSAVNAVAAASSAASVRALGTIFGGRRKTLL
jgi:hypothetical protein